MITLTLAQEALFAGGAVLLGALANAIAPRINEFFQQQRPLIKFANQSIEIADITLADPRIPLNDEFDLYPAMRKAVATVADVEGVTPGLIESVVETAVKRFDYQKFLRKKELGAGT